MTKRRRSPEKAAIVEITRRGKKGKTQGLHANQKEERRR